MSVAPGSRLGSYEVVGLLGAGGMGEVYRAHHRALGRDVALKVLPAAVSHDADRVARFEREARAVAALSHPNILAIHDFGSDHGVHYAVTELLAGQTLRDVRSGGQVPFAKAIAIATQIVRGLEAAHARGIVHRDLKPENVFVLNDGQIKILDFGLAKEAPGDAGSATTDLTSGATEPGTVLGSAGYMSPEQVRREAVDHRSDLFSLGCILYELLAGRRAFHGDSSVDTLHATLHVDPPDVATLVAIPESLRRIVARCLEKQPANRFQSAADLRFALDTISDTARSHVRATAVERQPIALRRVAMAASAIITMAGIAGVWYWRERGAATPAARAVAQPRGIAVLPFDSVGGNEQADFAAGVTEEVTLQLAKVSSLRVMSRAAVSRFKDPATQLPDMTRDLGIGAVLTGSVRQSGAQVRVGVQLLTAPGGETMWSEQYERTMANVFDVQSDIAVRVARALQASLAPEERKRIERAPTDNPEVYALYLQQRPLLVTVPEQNQRGIDLMQKAVAADPGFALGYAVLAQRFVFKGNTFGRAEYLRALEAGRQAVRIDLHLARGHHALGQALNRLGRVEDARLSMQRAIESDGNYGGAMNDLSFLETNAGRLDQAAYWAMRAWPLAPNTPNAYYHVALPLVHLDQAAGERWIAAASARFRPDDPAAGERIVRFQAILALRRGDLAGAVALARDAVRARPGVASSIHMLMEFATYAGAADAEALADKALADAPDGRGVWSGYTPRTLRAYLYRRAGQPDRARPLLETALDLNRKAIDDGDRSAWYETVAVNAMLGKREAALAAWERTVDDGFPESKIDVYDPMIASLKDDPRFVAALDRVKRRNAEMFARVDVKTLDEWIARGAPVSSIR